MRQRVPTTVLCRRSLLFAAVLAASSLHAGVLHDFENVPNLTTFAVDGSTVVPSGAVGLAGNALQLTYDLTGGSFAGIRLGVKGYDLVALGATGLRFQYRMTGPARQMEIELVDGDNADDKGCDKAKATFTPIADGVWRSITVSTASFSTISYSTWSLPGNGSFNNREISQFIFVVARGVGSDGTGSVFLDNFEFVNGGGSVVRSFETFSLPKNEVVYLEWSQNPGVPFPLSLEADETVPGASSGNQVGRVDYTLAAGSDYGGFVRVLNANFLAEPMVRFAFNGTGGNNTVEVKLVDIDGTVYVKKVTDVTDTGGAWKTASIPVDQFSFNAVGSDALLNLRRVTALEFVISRGEAKPGVLLLDTLESAPDIALAKSGVGNVLTQFSTPNNPFSPNGDGTKDTFAFNFTLSEAARVVLRVFNLQGVPIKTIDGGTQAAGDRAFSWDGVGDDGRLVANGLFFFVVEAEGVASGKDTVKQVVAVMR